MSHKNKNAGPIISNVSLEFIRTENRPNLKLDSVQLEINFNFKTFTFETTPNVLFHFDSIGYLNFSDIHKRIIVVLRATPTLSPTMSEVQGPAIEDFTEFASFKKYLIYLQTDKEYVNIKKLLIKENISVKDTVGIYDDYLFDKVLQADFLSVNTAYLPKASTTTTPLATLTNNNYIHNDNNNNQNNNNNNYNNNYNNNVTNNGNQYNAYLNQPASATKSHGEKKGFFGNFFSGSTDAPDSLARIIVDFLGEKRDKKRTLATYTGRLLNVDRLNVDPSDLQSFGGDHYLSQLSSGGVYPLFSFYLLICLDLNMHIQNRIYYFNTIISNIQGELQLEGFGDLYRQFVETNLAKPECPEFFINLGFRYLDFTTFSQNQSSAKHIFHMVLDKVERNPSELKHYYKITKEKKNFLNLYISCRQLLTKKIDDPIKFESYMSNFLIILDSCTVYSETYSFIWDYLIRDVDDLPNELLIYRYRILKVLLNFETSSREKLGRLLFRVMARQAEYFSNDFESLDPIIRSRIQNSLQMVITEMVRDNINSILHLLDYPGIAGLIQKGLTQLDYKLVLPHIIRIFSGNNSSYEILQRKLEVYITSVDLARVMLYCPAYRFKYTHDPKANYKNLIGISDAEFSFRKDKTNVVLDTTTYEQYYRFCKQFISKLIKVSPLSYLDQINVPPPNTLPFILYFTHCLANIQIEYNRNQYGWAADFRTGKLCQLAIFTSNQIRPWQFEHDNYDAHIAAFREIINFKYDFYVNNWKKAKVDDFNTITAILIKYFNFGQVQTANDLTLKFQKETAELEALIKVGHFLVDRFGYRLPMLQVDHSERKPSDLISEIRTSIINSGAKETLKEETSFKFLKYFLSADNKSFFEIIFNFYVSAKEKSIDAYVNSTNNFMKKLIDQDQSIPLNSIFQHIIDSKDINYKKELQLMYKYYYPEQKYDDKEELLQTFINRATSLYGIQLNIINLYEFFSKNGNYIVVNDLDEIRMEIDTTFNSITGLTIGQSQNSLEKATKLIGNLNYHQLKYFDLIHFDLIEFFGSIQDIAKFNEVITANLLNDEFNLNLMNNTIYAYDMLLPFIQYHATAKKAGVPVVVNSLTELCETISKLLPASQSELAISFERIASVISQLSHVKGLYLTAGGTYSSESILPAVVQILKGAEFISRNTKSEDGMVGWILKVQSTEVNIEFTREKIEDFVQGLKISTNDQNNKHAHTIEQFEDIVKLLTNIHHLHCELDRTFHTKHFGGVLDVKFSSETKYLLNNKVDELKLDLESWTDTIKKLPKRFWLLRAHGISSLISTYEEVLKSNQQPITVATMSNAIYPYIKYCYPVCDLSLAVITQILTACPELLTKMDCTEFLASLVDKIDEHDSIIEDNSRERGPVLVHLDSKVNLYNVLMQLNHKTVLPHPSQVFYAYSFGKDYQYIFDLVEEMQGYTYYLIGIPDEKDKLINWLSDHYSNGNKDLARFYIISTKSSTMATDLFSFLPIHNDPFDTNWTNFKALWEKRKATSGIESLDLVKGNSGTGKSFFIKSKWDNTNNPITVHMRPSSDIKSLIDHLKKHNTPSNTKKKVLIHFSISPYCDFDNFNHFFYPLITSGYVFGHRVGEILNVSDYLQLQIYVEIGSPKKSDTNVLPYNEYLNNSIPIVVNLAKHLDHTNNLWRTTATELKCFSYTKFTDITKPPTNANGADVVMNQYLPNIVKMLRDKFNYDSQYLLNPSLLIQRNTFLKLLEERLQFLDNYCINYMNTEADYIQMKALGINPKNPMKLLSPFELLPHFILESAKLADPVLSSVHNFWKNPPMITVRQASLMTADNETKVNAIIDYLDFTENPQLINIVDTVYTKTGEESHFRSMIGAAFDIISRTDIIVNLCHMYNYVLTPDFGLRLLMLHNKVKNQRSLVLSGDTGVGKTFILLFYSLLINAKNNSLPDIFLDLINCINLIIKDNEPFKLQGFKHVYIKDNQVHTDEAKILPGNISKEDIINCLKQLCDYEPPAEPEPQPTTPAKKPAAAAVPGEPKPNLCKTNKEMQDLVFNKMQAFITNMLKSYPLINVVPDSLLDRINKGEKVIQGKASLFESILEICTATFKNLFHRIIMHQKYTSKQLKQDVLNFASKAEGLRKIDKNLKMVVFIDEFNTSPTDTLSLINEIFIDGTVDGENIIPDNIFWVGAMNPVKISANAVDNTGTSQSNHAFVVKHPPPSMEQLFLNYGEFTLENEIPFLETLFQLRNNICLDNDASELMDFIIAGQKTMRELEQSRIHVSIRDITRAIDMYQFFNNSEVGISMLSCTFANLKQNPLILHWFAICASMGMTYYIRTEPGKFRFRLIEKFNAHYKKNAPHDLKSDFADFESIFKAIYSNFCHRDFMIIPEGIALTESLKLNIFCITVSINSRQPICIVGPPGCSKTLSFSIVMNNMNSKKHKITNNQNQSPWAAMPSADPFRYQSTPHTTDVEIKSVFEGSLKRQKIYDKSGGKSRCVVFIDEAGLVNENDSPMKVMHDYLDKVSQKMDKNSVDISVIILSNKVLDAAKTNRMLLLIHPSNITEKDERALVEGVLYNNNYLNENQSKICTALCKSYSKANRFTVSTKPSLFHQRDFVYFLRHLARGIKSNNDTLSAEVLLKSIERNFGGIPAKDFKQLAGSFFEEFEAHKELKISRGNLLDQDNTIQRIKESLLETLDTKQDPNTVPFRYMMIIDPTENESSLMILKELGIDPTVIRVGGFERDTTTEALVNVVSQIKSKMASGGTVVLVNTHQIDACFYDVFNRYFTLLPKPDGSMQFIANVSFGTHSIFCPVHPEFKIIVHLPLSQMPQTQLPWLNRFEKYQLSIETMLDYYIKENHPKNMALFNSLKASAKHFVDEFHNKITNKSLLSGFSESETIPSLIYSFAKESQNGILKINPHRVPSKDHPVPEETSEFRQFNWKLLQIARPESIFNCKSLPQSYIEEYLLRQEHFNILRFLDHIFKQKFIHKDETISNKWTFFTRTSLTLHRLKDSEQMDKFHKTFLELLTKDPNQKNILKIVQLGSFKSSFECETTLDKFIKSDDLKICIVIADMSQVNQHQINFIINKFSEHNNSKLLITICHYPPEFSLSNQTKLNSIFLNGMEYFYVDSLGLQIDSQHMEKSDNYIDSDIRTWIAKAYGLKNIHIDPISLESTFEKMFFSQLAEVSQTMNSFTGPYLMLLPPDQREFYTRTERRQALIAKLFTDHTTWYQETVRKFSQNWNQQKQFNQILSNISNLVLSGKYVYSFIDSIRNSMTSYVYPIVAQIFKILTNYQSYGQVAKIPRSDGTAIEPLEEMVRLYIQSVKVPKLSERVEVRFEPVTLVSPAVKKNSMLPLFDSVSNQIKILFDFTLNKNPNRGIDHIQQKFSEVIASHPIHLVVNYINQNDNLFSAYFTDFITRTMNLIDERWVPFIGLVIRSLSKQRLDSILHLTVANHFYSNTINYIKNLVAPLLNLECDENILQLLKDREKEIVTEKQAKSTVSFIAISILAKHIRETDVNDADLQSRTTNWCTVVREILNRIPIEKIVQIRSNKVEYYSSVCYIYLMFNIAIDIAMKPDDTVEPLLKQLYTVCGKVKYDAADCFDVIARQFHLLSESLTNQKLPLINTSCFLDIIEPFVHFNIANLGKFILICNHDPKFDYPFIKNLPIGWFTFFISNKFAIYNKDYIKFTSDYLKELKITTVSNPILSGALSSAASPTDNILSFIGVTRDQFNTQFKKNCNLITIMYYVFLDLLKQEQHPTNDLIVQYNKLLVVGDIVPKIKQWAYITCLLDKLITMLNTSDNIHDDLVNTHKTLKDVIFSLLKVNDADTIEVKTNKRMSQIYILFNIKSYQKLSDIMKSQEILSAIGMDDNCHIKQELTVKESTIFSFVIDASTKDGATYKELKTALDDSSNDLLNALLAKDTTPRQSGFIRMSLILIAYQYYIEAKPMNFIRDISRAGTALSRQIGLDPYRPYLDKIILGAFDPKTRFGETLMRDANKTHESHSKAQLLINLLAISVGSSNNNYLYHLTNDYKQVIGRYFPASDNYTLIDCGLRYFDNGDFKMVTSCMEGDIVNKYMITTTSWGAVAWTTSITDQTGLVYFTDPHIHFANYVNPKTISALTDYVSDRSLTTFNEFSNADHGTLKVEPGHFVSEFIYALWDEGYSNPQPAMRGKFDTKDQVIAYEKYLTELINKIKANYNQILLKRFKTILDQSPILRQVKKVRDDLATTFISPIIEYKNVHELISSDNQLLTFFYNNLSMICVSLHFNDLVKFIHMFFKYFTRRLPKEYENLTVPDCIKYLEDNKLETDEDISTVKTVWNSAKEAWNKILEHMKSLEGGCAARPDFEKQISNIDDNILLSGILSSSELQNDGLIINLINNWMDNTQAKAINLRSQVRMTPMYSEIIEGVNQGIKQDFGDINFEIGHENFFLIGTTFTVKDFQNFMVKSVLQYQSFDRSQFKPNISDIERKLVSQFVSGKITGGKQLAQYAVDFPYLNSEAPNPGLANQQENNNNNIFSKTNLIPESIKELIEVNKKLDDVFNESSNIEPQFNRLCFKFQAEELEVLCRYLMSLTLRINQNYTKGVTKIEMSHSIIDIGEELLLKATIPDSIKSLFQKANISSLKFFNQRFINVYLSFGYLYSNCIEEPCKYEATFIEFFDNMRNNLLSEAKESNSYLKSIEYLHEIIERLSSTKSQEALKTPNIDTPLIHHFKTFLQDLIHPIVSTIYPTIQSMVLDKIPITYYPYFMRTIHDVLSNLKIIHKESNSNAGEYREYHRLDDAPKPQEETPRETEPTPEEEEEEEVPVDDEDDTYGANNKNANEDFGDQQQQQNDFVDDDNNNTQKERFNRPIKPVAKCSYFHTILNWIRFKQENTKISQIKDEDLIIQRFKKDYGVAKVSKDVIVCHKQVVEYSSKVHQ
ncbi:hypothetical protein PPL_03700 [Heterostelium album PN500]|uniref:AAA+ ATPase domain-containing protein n=1 Tax=Heterostelium pallidum (strain ATCC 26659 / Pp 5 / PN500) TaxID=670386 RepID=D3B6F2_HETP5|nr:hypothetical protein PPL_03700 [Heterostelium album PN500]EFA82922.1 hypothetical protein PPL_03700 [Heterostelium album PN500]|eukprot:XP_020435039.1 hypothetical protein PPL_03700 [Heterostelium album PN500]